MFTSGSHGYYPKDLQVEDLFVCIKITYSKLMVKNSSQRANIHILIIVIGIVVLLGLLGFVYWKNSVNNDYTSVTTNTYSTKDWLVYEDDELPFMFKYPKDWHVVKEKGSFFLSDDKDDRIMSIRYVKMPPGLSRGVSACQIKRSNTDDHCSYIENDLVGYFYGQTKKATWTGVLNDLNADIIVELISKDEKSKSLLVGVVESIRLKQ